MRRRDPALPLPRRRLGTARLLGLVVVILALFATLGGRLAQVQLGDHADYATAGGAEATRTVVLPALRGRILDRHGTPLADNTTSVAVTADRAALLAQPDDGRALVATVAAALGLPSARLWDRTFLCGTTGAPAAPACWGGSAYVPVPLAEGVDPARALALTERPAELPGIAVVAEPVRSHPAPDGVNLAHVLGYLGRVTRGEVDASHGTLTDQDLVGRAGLEKEYDAELRGTPGRLVVAVDARGVATHEVSRTDPVPGKDLVTSLDASVQHATEKALADGITAARHRGERADSGAAVALDTRTGAVIASASFPAYDPGIWTGGISRADYARLTSPTAGTPLLSRTIAATYPPASTFKAISLPAAVAAGNSLTRRYDCPSGYRIGDRVFHNFESEAYGEITMHRAIEISCDTVFYDVAYRSWLAQGGLAATDDRKDPFVALSTAFGLGKPTGIDLPGEVAGRLPDRAWKKATWTATKAQTCAHAKDGYPDVRRTDPTRAAYLTALAVENCRTGFQFRAGDAANFAIGQGDTAVTPVQMAVAYAAIANGGTVLTPRVGAALVDPAGHRTPVAAGPRRTVTVAPATWAYLRDALRSVTVTGTARGAFAGFPADWPVAGKTGTGEVFGHGDTAWFMSYAPAAAPRYAVAVVVSQGGLGGSTAAPISRAVHAALRVATPH